MSFSVRSYAIAAVATLLAATSGAAQTGPKIAYLNSQQILAQAPGREEAEAQFKREMSGYQEQVKRMGDSLKTLVASYDKQEVILSPAAKEAKQKEIQTKEQEYQQRTGALEQQASRREAELTRPILDQIQKVINDIRAEDGYAFILDAGSTAGVVVAADKNLDITEKVLARLKTLAAARPRTGGTPAANVAKPAGPVAAPPAGVTRPKTPPSFP
ncbi:MAG: OmpH family outer membrane protein [Gemmatimonadaceae bacterium]